MPDCAPIPWITNTLRTWLTTTPLSTATITLKNITAMTANLTEFQASLLAPVAARIAQQTLLDRSVTNVTDLFTAIDQIGVMSRSVLSSADDYGDVSGTLLDTVGSVMQHIVNSMAPGDAVVRTSTSSTVVPALTTTGLGVSSSVRPWISDECVA